MKFAVVVFPGSNCDDDAFQVVRRQLQQPVTFVWHQSQDLENADVVILPGGFSYGDYLRTGALARFSPVMAAVRRFADGGGLVLGVCNGFQILQEAGLLPGAMLRNRNLRFICRPVHLRVENATLPFTNACVPGQVLTMPIAHGEGNFFADERTLDGLERSGRVVFRYATLDGQLTEEANPNGSLHNIAGIVNEGGNIMGMMPHPERASDQHLQSTDGLFIFRSLVNGPTSKVQGPTSVETELPVRV